MSIRMEGDGNLRRKLRRLTTEVEGAARVAVKGSAVAIQSQARRNATGRPGPRVQTGRLRNSIAHEVDADGLDARVGSNVDYAPYVELGTRRAPAYPFLFPAAEAERKPTQERFNQAVSDALRRAAR